MSKARQQALSAVIDSLKRGKSTAGAFDTHDVLEGLSTGSLAVDLITGIGGFPKGRLSEVFGWEGCLVGEAHIGYVTRRPDGGDRPDGKGRRYVNTKGGSLERLYQRFHGLPYDGRGRPPSADGELEFYAPSVNEDGRIFLNRILDVVDSGTKLCFRVHAGADTVVASADHKFLTPDGYVPLSELRPGATVLMHRGVRYSVAEADEYRGGPSRQYVYVKQHGVAGVKVVAGQYRYHRLLRSRAIIEATLNWLSFQDYIELLNSDEPLPESLKFLPRDAHVHHRDENFLNDTLDNLVVLPAPEHSRLHALDRHNDLRYAATPAVVDKIEVFGERSTYDIRMTSPFNNFVADRFVVHNSGKSTLCLQACAQAQRDGIYVAYLDVERGVDLSLATRIGFDWEDRDRGLYLQPSSFEETMEIVEKLAETGQVGLIIADSIPAMVPQAELDAADIEKQQMGARARLLATTLPKITKTLTEKNVAFVLVNQMRQRIHTGAPIPSFMMTKEMQEQSSGGAALRFYSSLRIDMALKRKGDRFTEEDNIFTGKAGKKPLANLHQATCFKNKVGAPYRSASFYICYDEGRDLWGVDNRHTVMMLAIGYGFIAKTGKHGFEYDGAGGSFKIAGIDELYDFIREHPEIEAALTESVMCQPEVVRVLERRAAV